MSIGMEDGRVPPKYLLEKALEQVKALAGQKPEDSPLALPLKNFPAAIPAAEQARIKTEMLGAIRKRGVARLHALCALSQGELYSRRPRRCRHLGAARRGQSTTSSSFAAPRPPS